ncbi:hypothetical protein MDOR_33870 [Mycolicibacterium doricum]|uniref:Uncharacterized protein n=1 Tax=Mycolicibacterium doricum TaxID=126673 RepID=A0A7I7W077_9MYCO|nr:hypothetical protein MDOR_33870 [Mycolicibacterium doricum]
MQHERTTADSEQQRPFHQAYRPHRTQRECGGRRRVAALLQTISQPRGGALNATDDTVDCRAADRAGSRCGHISSPRDHSDRTVDDIHGTPPIIHRPFTPE